MKMKQLKALQSVTKKTIGKSTPHEFLMHVFMHGQYVYAANDFMVIAVRCNEIKPDNPNYGNWVCLDLEACQQLEKANRYVNLNDPAALDFSEAAYKQCFSMNNDYFWRFFDMDIQYQRFNPDLLQLVCKVFKAFDIPIQVYDCSDFKKNITRIHFVGVNANYSISAMVMPVRS